MTTLSWNCWGLRSNLTVRRLEEMCREHLSDFLFLLETKNSSDHVERVTRPLGYDHFFLVNPVGLSGGLALFWKQSHEVEILSSSNRFIDTKVKAALVALAGADLIVDMEGHRLHGREDFEAWLQEFLA